MVSFFPKSKILNFRPKTMDYSGTSVSGPSQQRPTSLQRPKRRVRIDFSIDLTHFEPPNNGNGNLQTPASSQRPGSGTLYFRRKLPPRTAKFKTTPLFVKPHPLFVRRIHCNIHPYKGHLSTRAKRSDPKVALLRRFHCIVRRFDQICFLTHNPLLEGAMKLKFAAFCSF